MVAKFNPRFFASTCTRYYKAFISHFGSTNEAFIPSLVKNKAYKMCRRNTKKQQLSKSCQKKMVQVQWPSKVQFDIMIIWCLNRFGRLTSVPKIVYIMFIDGTVLNPNELNIIVRVACTLTVICNIRFITLGAIWGVQNKPDDSKFFRPYKQTRFNLTLKMISNYVKHNMDTISNRPETFKNPKSTPWSNEHL